MDSQLAPCRVCLKEINYEGYENSGKQARDEIVAHFSTEEFFEHNHHIFSANGLSSARTVVNKNTGLEDRDLSKRVEFKVKTKAQEALFTIIEKIAPEVKGGF